MGDAGGAAGGATGGADVSARTVADAGVDPAAAEAVLGKPLLEAAAASDEPEAEESVYETMKRHMRAKQEEIEAQNAALQQQRRGVAAGGGLAGGHAPGRAGPARAAPAAAAVETVDDLTDLEAVWGAARKYLATHARFLEGVLGACTELHALTAAPPPAQALVRIPNTQERFTNEKAQGKLEEALRAVTGLMLKLRVEFVEPAIGVAVPAGMGGGVSGAPQAAAQRVPPEVMEAVKKQAVVVELMKRFDATVTQVEMLGAGEGE